MSEDGTWTWREVGGREGGKAITTPVSGLLLSSFFPAT